MTRFGAPMLVGIIAIAGLIVVDPVAVADPDRMQNDSAAVNASQGPAGPASAPGLTAPPLDPFVAPPPLLGESPASPADSIATAPTLTAAEAPAGQNPAPFTGQPPFLPPSFNPTDGSMVGVAKPITINFRRPITDRAMAQQAVHISSNPPVPGKFYWLSDTQLRWRPLDYWPANTTVNIDAAGVKSNFRAGDSLIATIDDKTHQMEITRNGTLEKTFPVSLGKKGYETPNGTYYVLEKFADIVMDSSTYGVPIDAPEGYKLKVQDAVRISNTGIFVHSAPWSVGDQGKRNVSHGCPNLSPANAQWFFDHFGSGDPVVVKNSVGIYNHNDGAQDWQM